MKELKKYIKSIIFPLLLLFLLNLLNEWLPNHLMNFVEFPITFVAVYFSIIYLASKK